MGGIVKSNDKMTLFIRNLNVPTEIFKKYRLYHMLIRNTLNEPENIPMNLPDETLRGS